MLSIPKNTALVLIDLQKAIDDPSNNSVEATARVSGDLGFRTIVVSDATFTFGRRDFDGRFHTAEEVHAMSLANLDGEYASICTTDEVLKMAAGTTTG